MPEFNVIFWSRDVEHVTNAIASLDLVLVRGDYYPTRKFARTDPRSLLSMIGYSVAFAYAADVVSHVPMSKIEPREPREEAFYTINDLDVPEHLNISVFSGRSRRASFLGASHHPQFLTRDRQRTVSASPELRRKFLAFKRLLSKTATKVKAGGQGYLILMHAAEGIRRGTMRTNYGSDFDLELAQSLAGT